MKTGFEPYANLINKALKGQLDGLDCPECQHHAVDVWFTNPAPGEYRQHFICSNCGFKFSARIRGKHPAYFSQSRVHQGLQKTDEELFRRIAVRREEREKGRK